MTVAELEARMSSSELTEWMGYERLAGPLGARRADIQAATISATIANANRSKGKRFKVKDFLIPYGEQSRPRTGEEMLALVREINASVGGVEHGRRDD
jgi:hypothetical protein